MVAGTGVLKSSGSVKFSEIAAVYGYTTSTTANIKLGDYYKNGTYVTNSIETSIPDKNTTPKPSLSVSQLMGKSPRVASVPNKGNSISSSVNTSWSQGEGLYSTLISFIDVNGSSGILTYSIGDSQLPPNATTKYITYNNVNYSFNFGNNNTFNFSGTNPNNPTRFDFYFFYANENYNTNLENLTYRPNVTAASIQMYTGTSSIVYS